MLPYGQNLNKPARALRSNMTDAEQLLWSHVRRKQILGIQFYRQKPIGPFIVDFYAPATGLVIEVDGSQHYEKQHRRRDEERDAALATLGLTVLRFDNLQVLTELNAVMEHIYSAVQERIEANPPCPPFVKGG
ncbi:endonuclease domain-containing protein [Oryzomonas rubra]|uniref:Endonuclease domain-containing protein n=1 Tax=Oryzomonas rubra TaxID=2509454 RepID=A0A5A9XPL6_9BACT|nr:endonuclease domain-containing protein [Oryzomonas rubra]KAA0895107.1 endonuclease domain-containing protein [Oryzomonas rubra]